MKRKLALFLVIVLTMMSMVACGTSKDVGSSNQNNTSSTDDKKGKSSTTNNEDKKTLTVAWWGNQIRNDRTLAVLDLYTENNPNVKFDGQFSEWGDYWNKLAIASAGRSLPDIVQMDYRYVEQYTSSDLLVDLKPYIDDGTLDVSGIDQGILNSGSSDNGVYAICLGVNAPALLYNKTLLDANGIQVKDNMTMDEFIELSREIYEKTGYKTDVAYGNGDVFLEYFMRGFNIPLYKDGKLGVESADDLKPFFDIYEMGIKEGWHIPPIVFAEAAVNSVEQAPLIYGSSPETMSWCAFRFSNQLTATINAAPEGMEIGVTTWPSNDPKASNYLKPSQFFSVTADSKNPEEAAKVLNFFTNSVEANEILLGERGVPAAAPVATAIAPKLSATETIVVEYINKVVSPNSSTINPPAPDTASGVYDLMNKIEERLCYEQITAEEAAKELFEQGNKILSGQ